MRNYLKTEVNKFSQSVGQAVSGAALAFEQSELKGTSVCLHRLQQKNLSARHIEELWNAVQSEPDERCWTYLPYEGFSDEQQLRTKLGQNFNFPDAVHYLIEVNGQMVGWIALLNTRIQSRVTEIGNVWFSQCMKKSTAATEVVYLLLNACFEQGFRRVEWKCDSLNEPSKRAATRFGFQFEGIFRQDRVSKGRNRNTAWFSMLDEEWQEIRPVYQAWLKPENFDEYGNQRSRLEIVSTDAV